MQLVRERRLGMTYLVWGAQYRRGAVYAYHTSRCFVATAFSIYRCVNINMLGDALRDLFDPRLRGGLGRYR